jgi:hypothetical protein
MILPYFEGETSVNVSTATERFTTGREEKDRKRFWEEGELPQRKVSMDYRFAG